MKNDTLQDINQSIHVIPALEQRRERLLERIETSKEESKNLKVLYETTSNEADKMQRSYASQIYRKLTGKENAKMSMKTRDVLSSKLKYKKEREHLKDLYEESEDLLRRIRNLKQKRQILSVEIKRREKSISANANHDLFDNYRKIQKESTTASKQLIENEEALKASLKVLGSAKASQAELENAEGWTNSDIWGGAGLVSRTAKLSKIDHAQSTFNRLSTQMKDLERELADVQLTETTILSTISTANHMVEFWFDNILSDKDVSAVLRSNRAQIRVLISQVTALIDLLGRNEKEIRNHLEQLEGEKNDLIATCNSCQSEDGEEAACII